jgi:hypothetical protein
VQRNDDVDVIEFVRPARVPGRSTCAAIARAWKSFAPGFGLVLINQPAPMPALRMIRMLRQAPGIDRHKMPANKIPSGNPSHQIRGRIVPARYVQSKIPWHSIDSIEKIDRLGITVRF